jgi:hydroxymethylbilane synthase
VASLLGSLPAAGPCEIVVVQTTGDRLADVPIDRLGGQGAFVTEIQTAVLEGRADLAVHSAKDLPSVTPVGLVLACVPERVDPRDAMVGARLDDLAPGARVATGSVRRRAQLAWARPDLTFVELRGNMDRRLALATHEGAGVVAVAALERLGLTGHIAEVLDTGTLLPQVGQGAIGVECREDDAEVRHLLGGIDDALAHVALLAERAFLAALGSGCSLPVGALATPSGRVSDVGRTPPATTSTTTSTTTSGGEARDPLALQGMLASRDGRVVLRRRGTGRDPLELGLRLATELLEHGGRALDDWAPTDTAGP